MKCRPDLKRRLISAHGLRKPRGMTLGLVAMLALLIIAVLGAGFELMVYMGSSQELKNSVDAAALNMSSRAVENKVPASIAPGYGDVADTGGMFGLMNINRLWGKAYLVNANAEEMNQGGFMSGQAAQNAQQAYDLATQLNAQLFTLLNSKDAADAHFNQLTGDKPAKLLGEGGSVRTAGEGSWATACLYRGEESNLRVTDPLAIPPGVTPNLIQHGGTNFLQGYNSMSANGRPFCFTTFHVNESPHLVAASMFDAAFKSPVANSTNPIPNAFREGGALDGQLKLAASACAVANPMRTYQLTIPHAYLSITIQNTAVWMVQGTQMKKTNYDFTTGQDWQVKSYQIKPPGKGIENGYAQLGLEYQPPNLLHAIEALPGDHSPLLNKMLQRVKEFSPGYTMNQLRGLLQSAMLKPNKNTYYIYPTYSTPDNSDPKPRLVASDMPAGWMQPITGADGTEKLLFKESGTHDMPNTCSSNIFGGPYPTDKHWTDEGGDVYWKPGTGWQKSLGDVRISRQTTITFTALP